MSIFGKKKETIKIIEKVRLDGKWVSRNDDNILEIKGHQPQFYLGYWAVTLLFKDGTRQFFDCVNPSSVIYRIIEI